MIILWLWYDTYFFHFYFLGPFRCALLFTLLSSSVAFALIVFRYLLFPVQSFQLCLLLYFVVIMIILWLCFGTSFQFTSWIPSVRLSSLLCFILYLFLSLTFSYWIPFSCAFFFNLPWTSVTTSFCDLDPILTSSTFSYCVPSCMLSSLLCFILYLFLSLTCFLLNPFSCAFFFNLPWKSVTANFITLCRSVGSILTSFTFRNIEPLLYLLLSLAASVLFGSLLLLFLLNRQCAFASVTVNFSFCVHTILTSFTFYFLDPFSCALLLYFADWSFSVTELTLHFLIVLPILTSFTFTTSSCSVPSVVFTSLLCCDHDQLRVSYFFPVYFLVDCVPVLISLFHFFLVESLQLCFLL